ncbi:MAG TPA: cytochrome c biogenesis protein CcdA [Polyangiaceae bacterium]
MKPRSRQLLIATLIAIALVAWPILAQADDGGGSDTGAFQRALAHGTLFALGASYVFGLATSLTPCVYPMIAITVSVFGAKEAKSRWQGALLSLTFVLGIVCLFAPMGVASAMTGKGFGSALGNPWIVGAIALVFLALAASLFGAFELALPAGLNNRLSSVGGTGYRGAFLLGLVCGLVAAPCVGPFLFGLLGWIATTRNVALGSAAMTLYGLGLGTLFFVVGTFAVNLPKAGAWMMGIKWVGGVCLSYMALAYIRDALPKDTLHKLASTNGAYVVVGGVILFAGLALAGVHVAAERRRSPIARLSKPTKLASIVPAIAGLFMVLTWYQLSSASVASAASVAASGALQWESNETAAVAKANAEHKPLLVDFGASWCGACKELEEKTFPDARVRAEGSRFVALHVDATDDDDKAIAEVRQKYHATEGLPVVLLFASDGHEAMRFTEFVPPDRFAAALAKVQ